MNELIICIILLGSLQAIVAINSLDCICLHSDVHVKGDKSNFTIPAKTCVNVMDAVTGLHDDLWYHINYTSQFGWICFDSNLMWLEICGRKELAKHICLDVILNCKQYNLSTPNVCQKYPKWAKENCEKFCGLCDIPCLDMIDNCYLYGKTVCKNYFHWSGKNCRNYCRLCDPLIYTTDKPTTASFSCVDNKDYDCPFFKLNGLCDDPLSARTTCPVYCKVPECQ